MNISTRSLLFAALLPLAGMACAQAEPGPAASVTLDQFLSRQTDRIMAADTDGDGKVSRAEFDARAQGRRGNPERMFAMMDTNHDGVLDKAEIKAALTERFQRMDANHDGILTADERMAMRGSRQDQGQGASKGGGQSSGSPEL